MVDLFFVLSGFVIYNAYEGKIKKNIDLLRFQLLRFGRLYPVHLFLLLLPTINFLLKNLISTGYNSKVQLQQFNLSLFFENLFLIQAIIPYRPLSFNYAAWSISVEFYTYLLFGCIVLFFKKRKIIIFSFICACALLCKITNNTFGLDNLLRCFSGFFMGCLAAFINKNLNHKLPKTTPIYFLMLIGLFLEFKTNHKLDFFIYFLSAALVLSLVNTQNSNCITNKILNLKSFVWLGTVSYSFYMSHLFTSGGLLLRAISFYFKINERNITGPSWPEASLLELTLLLFTHISITLFISYNIYLYIEKPLREKSRKIIFENFT